MTIKHLMIFCTVCREKTMTKAADKLYMTQPAISRAISELENFYNVKLFERINHSLLLTPAGKIFYKDAENVLIAMETLNDHTKQLELSNSIRIGCSIGLGISFMPNIIKSYKDKYPETHLEIVSNNSSDIEYMVSINELDIGIIEGKVSIDNIESIPIYDDDLVIACSPSHPASKCKSIEELNKEKLFIPAHKTGTRLLLERIWNKHELQLTPYWSGMDYKYLIEAAINSEGVVILARHLLQSYLDCNKLIQIPIKEDMTRHYSLIYHRNKHISVNLNYLKDLCCKIKE